ncbi:MAG: FAD-dependent oxidoreductase [Alphaproteobacteria bacterium]
MHVIVCGGGVIGAAVAYFLARRAVAVTIVERTGVANAASGKSGGFLALDWCDGTPLQALARRSFALHAELAAALDDDWGYRRLDTYGGWARAGGPGGGTALGWVGDSVAIGRRLGGPQTTAQVHPARFTEAMLRAAQAHGARLVAGTVAGIDSGPASAQVQVDGAVHEADAVVVAMGPWSILAAQWLPLPAVYGLKGHSLVFETGAAVPAESLFLDVEEPSGASQSPEVFPRPDGTTYVCAISSESPLPVDPAAVAPDPGAIDRLAAMCATISPILAGAPVLARQACFRPVTRDGLPLIGRVAGRDRVFVATGHSVWGILNAPATGEAMAELIVDGAARTVDIAPFDPGRMAPFDPARLQAAPRVRRPLPSAG